MITRNAILILTCSILQIHALAQAVERDWKKSFPINANAELEVKHSYGSIILETWDQNTIDVVVHISVEARNDNKSQEIADGIEIQHSASADKVSLKTKYNEKLSNVDMEVVYTIKAPKTVHLNLNNSFGDIVVPSVTSPAVIDVSYGSLKAGSLSGSGNELKISFSQAGVDKMGKSNIDISYSQLESDDITEATIKSSFSQLEIDNIGKASIRSEYDSYEIDRSSDLDIDGGFSSFEIDRVAKRVKANIQYSNFEIDELDANFESVNIDSKMGGVEIGIDGDPSFTFDLYATNGGIDIPGSYTLTTKESDHMSMKKKGYSGDANATKSIRISTQYAGIELD